MHSPPGCVETGFTSSVAAALTDFVGVHMGRSEGCDGSYARLFCYDTVSNTWEWPLHRGEIPSAREDMVTVIVEDTVYLFGGHKRSCGTRDSIEDVEYNDLYTLDMTTMRFRKVHGNNYHDQAPNSHLSIHYTLTMISTTAAVLYGIGEFDKDSACWLLDLEKARQLEEPTSIWTMIDTPFPRKFHASVLEPVSQRHWVIGGEDDSADR